MSADDEYQGIAAEGAAARQMMTERNPRGIMVPRMSGLFNRAARTGGAEAPAEIPADPWAAFDLTTPDGIAAALGAAFTQEQFTYRERESLQEKLLDAWYADKLDKPVLQEGCMRHLMENSAGFSEATLRQNLGWAESHGLLPADKTARAPLTALLAARICAAADAQAVTDRLVIYAAFVPEIRDDYKDEIRSAAEGHIAPFIESLPRELLAEMAESRIGDFIRAMPDRALKMDAARQICAAGMAADRGHYLVGAFFTLDKDDQKKEFMHRYMPAGGAPLLARHLLTTMEGMEDPFLPRARYDQMVKIAPDLLRAEATEFDARRMAVAEKPLLAAAKKIMGYFRSGNAAEAYISLGQIMAYDSVPLMVVKPFVERCFKGLLKQGDAQTALGMAVHPLLAKNLKLPDLLDEKSCAALAAGLQEGGHEADLAFLARYVRDNHPEWCRADGAAAGLAVYDAKVDQDALLWRLAPILDPDNRDHTGAFLADVARMGQDDAARAQAAALDDVWQALERADPDVEHVTKHGRADLPMTADSLRDLAVMVADMMNVVQTQMPVIMPRSQYGRALAMDQGVARHWQDKNKIITSFTRITGSDSEILHDEDLGKFESGFGFLTINRPEMRVVNGQGVTEEKLLALPVITIDDRVFNVTRDHGGMDILRHFQIVAGIFNHDYFHHLTARIINPYFSAGEASIDIQKTPYGVLMGEENSLKGTTPEESEFGGFNRHSRLGMEQYYRFNRETYDKGGDYERFAQRSANYEYHALRLHNQLYQNYMDDGAAGQKMRAAVNGYMDGVQALGVRLQTASMPQAAQRVMSYYANLMAFHLRRVVPYGHPLMDMTEARIDGLGIDRAYCRKTVAARYEAIDGHGGAKYLVAAENKTGVSAANRQPRPAEAARWNSYLTSVGVLNMLYSDKYDKANAQALPALRQNIAVVTRDLKTVDYRGGRTAFDMYAARKVKDGASANAPPLLRDILAQKDEAARLVKTDLSAS